MSNRYRRLRLRHDDKPVAVEWATEIRDIARNSVWLTSHPNNSFAPVRSWGSAQWCVGRALSHSVSAPFRSHGCALVCEHALGCLAAVQAAACGSHTHWVLLVSNIAVFARSAASGRFRSWPGVIHESTISTHCAVCRYVDGREYFAAAARAIEEAKEEIFILGVCVCVRVSRRAYVFGRRWIATFMAQRLFLPPAGVRVIMTYPFLRCRNELLRTSSRGNDDTLWRTGLCVEAISWVTAFSYVACLRAIPNSVTYRTPPRSHRLVAKPGDLPAAATEQERGVPAGSPAGEKGCRGRARVRGSVQERRAGGWNQQVHTGFRYRFPFPYASHRPRAFTMGSVHFLW